MSPLRLDQVVANVCRADRTPLRELSAEATSNGSQTSLRPSKKWRSASSGATGLHPAIASSGVSGRGNLGEFGEGLREGLRELRALVSRCHPDWS